MKELNQELEGTVATALEQLELPFCIYDAYAEFKIDQALCCQTFSELENALNKA